MSQTFASLKFFNYRVWFVAALVANIGTWMQRVAQDWLVLTDLSDSSGVAVGIVTALQFAPALVLSPWAGVLADRLDNRRLLMVTQGAQGVLALALGGLVLSGRAELWHVYILATLLGVATAFDGPARQTFVTSMVPDSGLPNAVALNSASFNAARMIGPGVAGLLIAAVGGTGWVFVINGVSFAATIGAMMLMRRSELRPRPRVERAKGQLRAGVAYVRHRSDILVIMIVAGVVSSLGLNFQLTSALMATTVFGKGAGEYGMLGSILAIGSLGGALMAARRKRPRVRLVIGAAFAFGLAAGAMSLMPTYTTFAITSILVGFCTLTMLTSANAAIQVSTDPAFRGRVMSLYMMVLMGSTPLGSPLVGWIGETFGARWSIGVGAIASLVVAVGALLWTRKHWNFELRYRVRSRPHVQVRYLSPVPGRDSRAAVAGSEADEQARDTATAA